MFLNNSSNRVNDRSFWLTYSLTILIMLTLIVWFPNLFSIEFWRSQCHLIKSSKLCNNYLSYKWFILMFTNPRNHISFHLIIEAALCWVKIHHDWVIIRLI